MQSLRAKVKGKTKVLGEAISAQPSAAKTVSLYSWDKLRNVSPPTTSACVTNHRQPPTDAARHEDTEEVAQDTAGYDVATSSPLRPL